METKKLYAGLDIGTKYAMLSYYTPGMPEPETVSRVAGSEIYQIPQLLYRRKESGQWFYGEEALRIAQQCGEQPLEGLYMRAREKEAVQVNGQLYSYTELFVLFLKKLLTLPVKLNPNAVTEQLVITVEELDHENMELFAEVMEKLDIAPGHFAVLDYTESFYYYALSQKQELWQHDVALFDYRSRDLRYFCLERSTRAVPQRISVKEKNFGPLMGMKDVAFGEVLREAFGKQIFSAVYLTGEGFDGDWMQQSLQRLCRGRRVFMGKNLYTKGACYAAVVSGKLCAWNFVYMGENEMKFQVSLKLRQKDGMAFYNLITAGENWYRARGECEILLSGTKEISFWLQEADSREAQIQTLALTDLPERPDKMTRLRITAEPLSDAQVRVEIRDLGFGELVKSSDKSWEYILKI